MQGVSQLRKGFGWSLKTRTPLAPTAARMLQVPQLFAPQRRLLLLRYLVVVRRLVDIPFMSDLTIASSSSKKVIKKNSLVELLPKSS